MKRGLLILLASVALGLGAYFGMRSTGRFQASAIAADRWPELAWLRSELKLTAAQYQAVAALHEAYRPRCASMCQRIAASHAQLQGLATSGQLTPALTAALADHAAAHVECQQAMLTHLYETAHCLDPTQAQAYLQQMLPYALDFSHSEASP